MPSTPSERRLSALDMACRVADRGAPTGHVLSTARQFEKYLTAGLSQVGPRRLERLIGGDEGVVVEVDARLLDDVTAQQVADSIARDVAMLQARQA